MGITGSRNGALKIGEPDKSLPHVPRGEITGYAPGGIPSYSNYKLDDFPPHVEGKFRTGVQWQCVEFARRWLLHRKGLILPDVFVAHHIFYVEKVINGTTKEWNVPTTRVRNGSGPKPTADSLIIYSCQFDSFPGHVGVITEVGDDFVRVADQNRYDHDWNGKSYAYEFPLKQDPKTGAWYIVDEDEVVLGWVEFPASFPNRPDDAPKFVVEGMTEAPEHTTQQNLSFWRRSTMEVKLLWRIPYMMKFAMLVTLFMVVAPAVSKVKGLLGIKSSAEPKNKKNTDKKVEEGSKSTSAASSPVAEKKNN